MRNSQPGSTAWRAIGSLTLMAAVVACSDSDYESSGPDENAPEATVVTGAGDLTAKLDEFRGLIGEPNNGGTEGEQPAGRREISWDGAGANPFNNRNDFPATFFNTNATFGAIFDTDGTGLRNDSTLFADVDASYSEQFNFFSPTRIFAPVGSPRLDVLFQVAGETAPASVTGFGAVFSDVDRAGSTKLEVWDATGKSLGSYNAPVRADAGGFSFVGVKFDDPIIARVRITLGDAALAPGVYDISAGGQADLVVVDNLIYGEPRR